MQGFIYFLKYAYQKQKRYVILNILQTVISAISPVILMFIPKLILDMATQKNEKSAVIYVLLYAASYLGLKIWISWNDYLIGIYGGRLFATFQMDMANKLLDADLDNLESKQFRELSEKAKKYIYADGWGFGYVFSCTLDIIKMCITGFSYIVIIFKFSPILVLINLVFSLISFYVEGVIKKKEKQDQDARIKHERETSYYTDIVSNHKYTKDIRLFHYKPTLLRKMEYHYDKNISFYKRMNRRHTLGETLTNIFYMLQSSIGYFFVIRLLVEQNITVGDFTLYISAITMYASMMASIMEKVVYVHSYDMYFHDFKEYMSIPNMKGTLNKKLDNNVPLTIEFRNVSFRYAGSDSYALKNVNLKVSGQEHIAIVGENGSGKTTFVKLLMRLYDPTEGAILVNGVNIKEYEYDEYLNLFSPVFQDYSLFATSIEENIAMDEQKKIDTQFVNKLEMNGLLKKVIHQYPKRFTTSVYKIFDEEGIELSGGEGQQIAIARSLMKDAQIYILDEPTAALDPKVEYEMYEMYNNVIKNKLSFFVSHRLGSCKFADRIIVFSNGSVVEDGSHSYLLQCKNKYYELYNYQASLYQYDNTQEKECC